MSDERRYRDDEIAQIFETAATPDHSRPRAPAAAGGLTLAELQGIGREVGIAPERIAEAALAVRGSRTAPSRRTSLGLPITVGKTVDLPRSPTGHEWAILVGELRETFRAQGREVSHGNTRGWINGNLHAYVEPSQTGYRFRLGTLKGDAVAINRIGIGGWVIALVLLTLLLVTGELSQDFMVPILLALMGSAALTYNALSLPAWAREREEQMEYIADRARALITSDSQM